MSRPGALAMIAARDSPGEIPANRDFNREFTGKWPSGAIFGPKFRCVFNGMRAEIPTRRNRDFFEGEQGFFRAEQGTQRAIF
jgi:hypothetical protein